MRWPKPWPPAKRARPSETEKLLAASERRHALETQSMMVRVQEYLDVEKKRLNRLILASNEAAPQEAR